MIVCEKSVDDPASIEMSDSLYHYYKNITVTPRFFSIRRNALYARGGEDGKDKALRRNFFFSSSYFFSLLLRHGMAGIVERATSAFLFSVLFIFFL